MKVKKFLLLNFKEILKKSLINLLFVQLNQLKYHELQSYKFSLNLWTCKLVTWNEPISSSVFSNMMTTTIGLVIVSVVLTSNAPMNVDSNCTILKLSTKWDNIYAIVSTWDTTKHSKWTVEKSKLMFANILLMYVKCYFNTFTLVMANPLSWVRYWNNKTKCINGCEWVDG